MTSTLSTRTDTVAIYQGEDYQEFLRLDQAVRQAAETAVLQGAKRLGDADPVVEAAAEHDTFLAEAKTRAFIVHVAALKRSKWRELVAAHEPREGNEDDKDAGFNVDTMADALVPKSVTAITGPDDTPVRDVDEFLDDLNDADFSRIYSACYKLNQGNGPFGPVSSRLGLTSAAT